MTPVSFPLSADGQRRATRVMQVAIAAILSVGIWQQNVSVILNAAIALVITFLPAILERDYRIALDAGLTLWITTALLLHTIGMVGPYETIWWWDHLTHTLSATIVAAVGYATTRALDEHLDSLYLPPEFTFVFILLFTLAFGVFWEVLEFAVRFPADWFGFEPVLIQYSVEDTIIDLVFDLVGAVLVALFGTGRLSDLVETLVLWFGRGERAGR